MFCCNNHVNNDYIIKVYNEKKFDKVISLVDNEIKRNSRSDFLYRIRGYAYFKLHNFENASNDLVKSFSISKDTTPIQVVKTIAECDVFLGRYTFALDKLNHLILYDSSDAELFFLRGITYNKLNLYNKSLIDLNKAIYLNSEYDVAYNERGLLYRNLKEYVKSINDFTKYISIDSTSFFSYYNRGVTYLYLKENNKAINDFNKALLLKDTSIVYYNRAVAYSFLKEKQKSCDDLYKSRVMGFNRIDSVMIKYCSSNDL